MITWKYGGRHMRFSNKTNIPNKVVQNVVNNINNYSSLYSFADKYGNNTTVYRIPVQGYPDLMVNRSDNYCNVTTVGNNEFYNTDKDGKKIVARTEEPEISKKKK